MCYQPIQALENGSRERLDGEKGHGSGCGCVGLVVQLWAFAVRSLCATICSGVTCRTCFTIDAGIVTSALTLRPVRQKNKSNEASGSEVSVKVKEAK